ncbi:PilZ domain-containing protein [Vibrio nitrifigilis]|uniref:Flagellar brake protein n=1 Tax=Vibrio nitrifigilis TaxID=2789781 RepID=A0ABS0GMD9_9VIBR|nr:flagellar brake protein [Vibrio nitrifigilis]MBF9003475.1 flagellar brake protein [Vibrio nitrifigilis]
MNSQLLSRPKKNATASEHDSSSTILNSTDALGLIEHGSELTLNITTPVGMKYSCKTRFIGSHSLPFILVEPPKISVDDFNDFFQEGFWLNGKAIGQRGHGSVINFRSQIVHRQRSPIPMIALSVPNNMHVTQLRKEPRYSVSLDANVIRQSGTTNCEIRDLSKNGCRFVTSPLSRPFDHGNELSLVLQSSAASNLSPLTGTICNVTDLMHYTVYGLKFDEQGKKAASELLKHMKFNGSMLSL